ncbi:hypothetical protein DPMN_115255 [Dreissena polymorpha]|uniref:LicD/FKTN/FKRP nucleotidyltransferase domain-containing protein n=1 Tax=Dreissena polymorpha TaxID=45954 RepID=A0A9D4KKV5_DREPO|nr:hypothetical protein DPMN_115255 [Dreissena polymorpha]
MGMIRQFQTVCETDGIAYFFYGGSLIGSYRHFGMVPWDDDIDILLNVSDKQRLRDGSKDKTATHKTRNWNGIQRTVQEVRARPTYSSNIEDRDVEVTTLPPPVPKPGPAGLDTTGKEFVFFDLETRGLERTSHIIQIAAVHSTGQFSTYVMPEKKMSLKASEITGVTVVGDSMLVKGQTRKGKTLDAG